VTQRTSYIHESERYGRQLLCNILTPKHSTSQALNFGIPEGLTEIVTRGSMWTHRYYLWYFKRSVCSRDKWHLTSSYDSSQRALYWLSTYSRHKNVMNVTFLYFDMLEISVVVRPFVPLNCVPKLLSCSFMALHEYTGYSYRQNKVTECAYFLPRTFL